MKQKKLIGIICLVAACLLILVNTRFFKIFYIKLLNKSESVFQLNSKRHIDGEVLKFVNGKIYMKWNFIDGLKQGSAIQYYKNGKVEDIGNYKNDKPEGKESKYYENGKLNYIRNWRNGKLYGDFYWYLENGQLDSYNIFDISENQFCLYKYDKLGKVIDVKGFVVSENIYSFDYKADSLIILNSNRRHYYNIKDLYITVAIPPSLNQKIEIYINKKQINGWVIKNNTIKIPNVFLFSGTYEIIINSKLIDKNNNVVNGLILKTTVMTNGNVSK